MVTGHRKQRPIIILGCPRSGTLLTSRIIGGPANHFLVTEHSNKTKHCPEDTSGIIDSELWWKSFEYHLWDRKRERPLIETPIYDKDRLERLKNYYLDMAQSKRLVIKNPAHLCRVHFLKKMFPDALFVFCIRNPWHTLQSMVIKGNMAFLLKTYGNYCLPDDLLLKAAFAWGESVEIFLRERDENWCLAKYEDVVSSPNETIPNLYDFLSIDNEHLEQAMKVPEFRSHNYNHLVNLFRNNLYQSSIIKSIDLGCDVFGYSKELNRLPRKDSMEEDVTVKKKGILLPHAGKIYRMFIKLHGKRLL